MSADKSGYRQCDGCGEHIPRDRDACPMCGRLSVTLGHLLRRWRLLATLGPALVALFVVGAIPSDLLVAPADVLFEAGTIGVGFAPLLLALARLMRTRGRRDPSSYAARIEATEARLAALERDLADTAARIAAARQELTHETSDRIAENLRRELGQDRRLRVAQRRLASQLEARAQALEIERFRAELAYYEACRDECLDAPHEAQALTDKISALRTDLGAHPDPAWLQVIDDARALQVQLARGIQRLQAARRLDPLAYADLSIDLSAPEPDTSSADLDAQTELHLERIDRGFEALDELNDELEARANHGGDPDASGLRLRVDDEVLAALDAEEEVVAPRELGKRTSVDGL